MNEDIKLIDALPMLKSQYGSIGRYLRPAVEEIRRWFADEDQVDHMIAGALERGFDGFLEYGNSLFEKDIKMIIRDAGEEGSDMIVYVAVALMHAHHIALGLAEDQDAESGCES